MNSNNDKQLDITAGANECSGIVRVTFDDDTQKNIRVTVLSQTAVLTTGNWTKAWEGLPSKNSNNEPYYYYIIEPEVPNGYTASYAVSDGKTTITNTQKTVDLQVRKEWADSDIIDHSGETIKFVIKRSTDPNDVPDGAGEVYNGTTYDISVTTTKATTTKSLELNAPQSLNKGETGQISVNKTNISDTENVTYKYSSDGETWTDSSDIVSISDNTITANSAGTVHIKAECDGVKSNVVTVTVSQPTVSLTINGHTYTGTNNDTLTLQTGQKVTISGVGGTLQKDQLDNCELNTEAGTLLAHYASNGQVKLVSNGETLVSVPISVTNPSSETKNVETNGTLKVYFKDANGNRISNTNIMVNGAIQPNNQAISNTNLSSDGSISIQVSNTQNNAYFTLYYASEELYIDTVEYTVPSSETGNNEEDGDFIASVSPISINQGDTTTVITITATDTILEAIPSGGQLQGLTYSEDRKSVSGYLNNWVNGGTFTVSVVHSYNPEEVKTTVSIIVVPSSPAPPTYKYRNNLQTLLPYTTAMSEAPSKAKIKRPLRGGSITKTVGAEAEESKVTELFFNTNVSDIIEMGAGIQSVPSMNLSLIGGKVKLSAAKQGTEEDAWTKVISGLPAADANGNTYYYWIEEIPVDGYIASYENNRINAVSAAGTQTITITNTRDTSPHTLPEAGSTGTKFYTAIGGIMLILSAAGYTTIKRRRWFEE